jgi:hypothetical protein
LNVGDIEALGGQTLCYVTASFSCWPGLPKSNQTA